MKNWFATGVRKQMSSVSSNGNIIINRRLQQNYKVLGKIWLSTLQVIKISDDSCIVLATSF